MSGRSFVPGVIEPSFGIGRIMYSMFEHTYYAREVCSAVLFSCVVCVRVSSEQLRLLLSFLIY